MTATRRATIARIRLAVGAARTTVGALATTLATRGASWRRSAALGSLGLVEAIERDLAGLRVDLDDLYLDGVAHVEHVLDLADAAVGHAGDMKQAVLGGRELTNAPKVWMSTTWPS